MRLDQHRRHGRHQQCPAARAGRGQTERGRAMAVEPPADDRQRRDIGAGRPDADAKAIGQVANPHLCRRGREHQSGAHDDRARRDDAARTDPIAETAGDRAEDVEQNAGDREEGGGRGAAGTELRGHRREEHTEAVHHAESRETGDEGGQGGEPAREGIRRIGCRVVIRH